MIYPSTKSKFIILVDTVMEQICKYCAQVQCKKMSPSILIHGLNIRVQVISFLADKSLKKWHVIRYNSW